MLSEVHLLSAISSLPRADSVAASVEAGLGISQRSLSRSIDRAEADAELVDRRVPDHIKAHVQLITVGGADSWMHAYPNKEAGTLMDSELFRIAVARRMRLPIIDEHATCSECGACLDVYLDHALVCSCGGDRTLRHNTIRDEFFEEAQAAGVRCEKEKLNLLPLRPDEEQIRGEDLRSGRRPADVWLAHWGKGRAGAVDFAVTSGLRNDFLSVAAQEPAAVWGHYETFKRQYLGTEASCNERNIEFLPFVVEAHGGGLGPVARRVCASIAQAAAARAGEEVTNQAASLLRRITYSLHRENARAVLRRLFTPRAAVAQSFACSLRRRS